jgi:muconolactone delta-isomerase
MGRKMKILAIEQNVSDTIPDDFAPLLRAEAQRVWELQQVGLLREIYFVKDERRAVLLLECENAAEAQEIINILPLVQAGLIAFEILPLTPYPGIERLFDR